MSSPWPILASTASNATISVSAGYSDISRSMEAERDTFFADTDVAMSAMPRPATPTASSGGGAAMAEQAVMNLCPMQCTEKQATAALMPGRGNGDAKAAVRWLVDDGFEVLETAAAAAAPAGGASAMSAMPSPATPTASSGDGGGGVGAEIAFSTPWKCDSCTFVNTDCTRCNMCDTIKPPDYATSDSGPTAFGSSAAFHRMDKEDALAAVAAASGSSAASRRTALKKNVSFAEVPEAEWMKNSACKLCCKGFTLFHRRHHCRLCGSSVCDDCSSLRMRMGKKKRCCYRCREF